MNTARLTTFFVVVCSSLSAATTASAAPVITEIFFNPAGSSESAYEWFEIYNPGPADLDISGLVVESRSATNPRVGTVPLGITPIIAGGYAVLSKSPLLGLGCYTAGIAVVLEGTFGLNNSNARVAMYPAGTTDFVATTALDSVEYRGAGFPPSTDGVASQLTDVGLDNSLGSSWELAPTSCPGFAVGSYGSPGVANSWCGAHVVEDASFEDAGAEDAGQPDPICLPPPDAGVPDVFVPVDAHVADAAYDAAERQDIGFIDAGPQNEPTIALQQPSSSTTANPSVNIEYTASDPDGDPLTVALFYDTDSSGNDGVLLVEHLEPNGSYRWTPTGVPQGEYWIFGRALDSRGGIAYAYAGGTVTVEQATIEGPKLTLSKPDSSKPTADEDYTIVFDHNGVPGTIALYYDTDSSGENGVAIMGGIAVPGGPKQVLWNTRDVDNGSYYIYGKYETDLGTHVAYSPGAVSVNHPGQGCACEQARPLPAVTFSLVLFALLLHRGRRHVARR